MDDAPTIWRDEHGVVHTAVSDMPLPADLVRLIESYLGVSDWNLAMERPEQLADMLGELEEAAFEEAATSPAVESGPSCDDDEGEPSGEAPALAAPIPGELVTALTTSLNEMSIGDRIDALYKLSELVHDWQDYSLNQDTLLGHLIREHNGTLDLVNADHEALIALHAAQHATDHDD